MANHLISEEEKKSLTETFVTLDTNGNGFLNKEELKKGYSKFTGITDEELETLIDKIDVNHNHEINFKGT